jgi:hypothetical protein
MLYFLLGPFASCKSLFLQDDTGTSSKDISIEKGFARFSLIASDICDIGLQTGNCRLVTSSEVELPAFNDKLKLMNACLSMPFTSMCRRHPMWSRNECAWR